MIVELKKILVDDDCIIYKIKNITKCCDKVINSKAIYINDNFSSDEIYYDPENPPYSAKIASDIENYDMEYDEINYIKINYCPFCGKPIIIKIVEEIDMIKKFKQMEEERDIYYKKALKSINRSKIKEMYDKSLELDSKINEILRCDTLESYIERNEGNI